MADRLSSQDKTNPQGDDDSQLSPIDVPRHPIDNGTDTSYQNSHSAPQGSSSQFGGPSHSLNPNSDGSESFSSGSNSSLQFSNPDSQSSLPRGESDQTAILDRSFDENDKTVIRSEFRVLHAADLTGRNLNPDQFIGYRLAGYELIRYIGGSSSVVFKARDLTLDRDVALKILLPNENTPDTQKRFQNEAKACAKLQHENIARVHFAGCENDLNYIAFEFVPGNNLRKIVKELGPLPVEMALKNTIQIALALQQAFVSGVTHRDVKPSNAVVSQGGHVKLVDMGLARDLRADGDLTSSGATLGTFDYLSPEQAEDPRKADTRSDLYSLGCTLYFMLTGRAPYGDGTPVQKVLRHKTAPRPDPRVLRPEIPKEISLIIKKLMAVEPSQRFQSPNQLVAELLKIANRSNFGLPVAQNEIKLDGKPIPKSLIERIAPVAIPVLAIFLCILGLEYVSPVPTVDSGLSRITESGDRVLLSPYGSAPQSQGDESTNAKTSTANKKSKSAGENKEELRNSNKGQGSSAIANKGSDKELEKTNLNAIKDDSPTRPKVDDPKIVVLGPGKPEEVVEIIVGSNTELETSKIKVCQSLNEAFASVQNYSNLKKISLQYDGFQKASPIYSYIDELTIEAGESYNPVIEFDLSTIDPATLKYGELIQVRGSNLSFSNVHFHVRTDRNQTLDSVSLFGVEQIQMIELNKCSLTIENSDNDTTLWQPRASFFNVRPFESPRMNVPDMPRDMKSFQPFVQLNDFVIRGQATVIRSDEATPVAFSMTNGLIVTPERLFEIGGTAQKPEIYKNIEVSLKNVTAQLANGIGNIRISTAAPFPYMVSVTATSSIFKVMSDIPLIKHEKIVPEIDLANLLKFSGEDSYFPIENPVWIIDEDSPIAQQIRYDFDLSLREQAWFDVDVPGNLSDVQWKTSPRSVFKPSHVQTVIDHQIVDRETNPAFRKKAGFDVTEVPNIPIEIKMPIENASLERSELE